MRVAPISIIGVLVAFAWSGFAQAATINVPGDQPTIRAAVDAASPAA